MWWQLGSLEPFKEHPAPLLHVNAIIILVFLSADTTLTFTAFFGSFVSGRASRQPSGAQSLAALLEELERPPNIPR